jgi:hypothetical protein
MRNVKPTTSTATPMATPINNTDSEKGHTRLTGATETNPELEKRLNRKFDLHVVPWLFGLWLLAFIDRANIGNAAVVGLEEDLNSKTRSSTSCSPD